MHKVTHAVPFHLWDVEKQNQTMSELARAGEKYVVLSNALLEEGCKKTDYLLDFHSRLQSAGLEFLDAHAPWGKWSDPGMPLEKFHGILIDRQKIALRFCRIFGVTTITYHTGNTFNSIFGKDLKLEDYYAMLMRSIEELLPFAESCGVTMALENQWTPLNHSSIMLKVMENFNSPFLGVCYDAGHGNLSEKGVADPARSCVPTIWNDLGVPVKWEEELIEKLQPWLVNCHLTDNHGWDDEHLLPGKGNVDWTRIMHVLENAPKLRCIQNECRVPQGMSVTDFCKNFRRGIGYGD